MKSFWSDEHAKEFVETCAREGVGKDIALRLYTTRLLGGDRQLTLHGGGNTSVKITLPDLLGDAQDVLCVKGSGHDMATIEAAGLPALRIEPLLRLCTRDYLSDEDMVSILRSCLLCNDAPTPSVETLLHAALPHKYVDHTHASAILTISNQPDGEAIVREIFGKDIGIVPYMFSGFSLAKKASEIYEENPYAKGLILLKHGIFTYGKSAQESYERMIELVNLAENWIVKSRKENTGFVSVSLPEELGSVADTLPIIRGACAQEFGEGKFGRLICDFRTSSKILEFVNGVELKNYGQRGVVTPDNVIRIKNTPLIVPAPNVSNFAGFKEDVDECVRAFVVDYYRYFGENNTHYNNLKTVLDPMPRLVLVPGLGMIGLGENSKAAQIAADIGQEAISIIRDAEVVGKYAPLSERAMFEMEYWSLEQAKLGEDILKPLVGQVVVITGGAGAIGAACAQLFAENGAEVAVLDLDAAAAEKTATQISRFALGISCDVTDPLSVRNAFDQICQKFGGVDIIISNAGAAWQGRIGELDDSILRKSFDLNFFSHQCIAQNGVRIMQAQKTGGALLFNASKQAINPGENFGAYGLPKAATLFLSRQYALEYGQDGIRSNAVNADRIRSGLLSDDMIKSRSKARGLSESDYLAGNLLHREVSAMDVAQAFFHHALALKTTADVTTVDGGNIAAILR